MMGWRLVVLTLLVATLGVTGLLSLSLFSVGYITEDYSYAKSFPVTSYILENQERYRKERLQNTLKEENWRQEAETYQTRVYPGWIGDLGAGFVSEVVLNSMTWTRGKEIYRKEFHLLLKYQDGQVLLADTSSFDDHAMRSVFVNFELRNISNELRKSGFPEITFILGETESVFIPINTFLEGLRGIGLTNSVMIVSLFGLFFIAFVLYVLVRYQMTRGKLKLPPSIASRKTFEDIGGLKEAKKVLKEVGLIARYPQIFLEQGGVMIRGVSLSGLPGTGKTLLMESAVNEIGIPIFPFKSTEFVDSGAPSVGASRMAHIYQQARKKAPCVLFFDEAEVWARERKGSSGEISIDLALTLSQALSEIGGIQAQDEKAWREGRLDRTVVTIIATNRPEFLDEALLRSKRIGRHLLISPPNIDDRKLIAKIHARNKPFPPDKKDEWLNWLVQETSGFTGADIADILDTCANKAAERRLARLEEAKKATPKRSFLFLRFKPKIVTPLENIIFEDLKLAFQEKQERFSKTKADPAININKKVRANHQAGHKIGERSRMGRKSVKPVSIIPGREHYQQTYWWKDLVVKETDIDDKKIRDLIAVYGCGRAAEMEVFGRVSFLSGDDFNKASEAAISMATTGMIRDTFLGVLNRNEEERKLSDKDIAERSDKIKLLMKERFFDKATEIIRTYRPALDALTALLLSKEDCTAEEINEVLDRFNIPEPEERNNNHNNGNNNKSLA